MRACPFTSAKTSHHWRPAPNDFQQKRHVTDGYPEWPFRCLDFCWFLGNEKSYRRSVGVKMTGCPKASQIYRKKLDICILDFWIFCIFGHISGTKRATGDLLVLQWPDFLVLFSYLCGSHGLSARRARRTMSGGLKGLQLEFKAQRAPRLRSDIFSLTRSLAETNLTALKMSLNCNFDRRVLQCLGRILLFWDWSGKYEILIKIKFSTWI